MLARETARPQGRIGKFAWEGGDNGWGGHKETCYTNTLKGGGAKNIAPPPPQPCSALPGTGKYRSIFFIDSQCLFSNFIVEHINFIALELLLM